MGILKRLFGRKKKEEGIVVQECAKSNGSKNDNNKSFSDDTSCKKRTLNGDIDEFIKSLVGVMSKDTLEVMAETTRDLIDMDMAKNALRVSDQIPEFELSDANGNTVRSKDWIFLNDSDEDNNSSTEQKTPNATVIVFYRGHWCPFCNLQLAAYQEYLQDFEKYGCQLVAISPNLPEYSRKTVQEKNLQFTVLSDVGNKVSEQFGLVFEIDEKLRRVYKDFGFEISKENGDDSYRIPLSSTYIVDNTNGKIIYAYVEADYKKRPEANDIIKVLQEWNVDSSSSDKS